VLIPWPIARLGHEDTTVMTSSAAPLLSRLIWRLRWVGASVVIGLAIAVPLLGLWSASQGAASRSSASASGPDRSIRSTAQPELPFDRADHSGDALGDELISLARHVPAEQPLEAFRLLLAHLLEVVIEVEHDGG
jgi:hypothetical protein